MFRLYIALGPAVVAGTLTFLSGLLQDVRPLTLIYRTLISSIIFAAGGFMFGSYLKKFPERQQTTLKPKGQNIDIISEDNIAGTDELLTPAPAENEFSPLTPNDFDHISTKE